MGRGVSKRLSFSTSVCLSFSMFMPRVFLVLGLAHGNVSRVMLGNTLELMHLVGVMASSC